MVKMEMHRAKKHWWKGDSPCTISQAPHAQASLSLRHKFHLLSPPASTNSKTNVIFTQWTERSESSETDRQMAVLYFFLFLLYYTLYYLALSQPYWETWDLLYTQSWSTWSIAGSLGHRASPVTATKSLTSWYSTGAGTAGEFWSSYRYMHVSIKVKIKSHS